jgi:hypothetical protein
VKIQSRQEQKRKFPDEDLREKAEVLLFDVGSGFAFIVTEEKEKEENAVLRLTESNTPGKKNYRNFPEFLLEKLQKAFEEF